MKLSRFQSRTRSSIIYGYVVPYILEYKPRRSFPSRTLDPRRHNETGV